MQKEKLFNKLKNKGIFWSYSKELTYEKAGDKLFLEYLLKYGDFDDLILAFKLYPQDTIKLVWEQTLKDDKRFIKLNLLLARVFFGMNVNSFPLSKWECIQELDLKDMLQSNKRSRR